MKGISDECEIDSMEEQYSLQNGSFVILKNTRNYEYE